MKVTFKIMQIIDQWSFFYARMKMAQKPMSIAVLASNSHHRSLRFELCGTRSGSVGVMSWFGHQAAWRATKFESVS